MVQLGDVGSDDASDGELTVEGLVSVGTAPSADVVHDEGLVVLACGDPYWVVNTETGYALLVEPTHARWIAAQLELYREERARPRRVDAKPEAGQRVRVRMLVLPPLACFVMFALQQRCPGLTEAGLADSAAVLDGGEWWRTVTALTLHGDIAHVTANACGWLLFGAILATSTGVGMATLLALLAGGMGNWANLLMLAGNGHRSLGASTALFAALGLQTAFAFFLNKQPTVYRRVVTPVLASAALLALMGGGSAGSGQTDIGAHLWGYGCGLLLALPFGALVRRRKISARADWLAFAAASALVLLCWSYVLR